MRVTPMVGTRTVYRRASASGMTECGMECGKTRASVALCQWRHYLDDSFCFTQVETMPVSKGVPLAEERAVSRIKCNS